MEQAEKRKGSRAAPCKLPQLTGRLGGSLRTTSLQRSIIERQKGEKWAGLYRGKLVHGVQRTSVKGLESGKCQCG